MGLNLLRHRILRRRITSHAYGEVDTGYWIFSAYTANSDRTISLGHISEKWLVAGGTPFVTSHRYGARRCERGIGRWRSRP